MKKATLVTYMYMSLTQGKESYFEKPSINVWNANSQNKDRNVRDEIEKIREFVAHLQHLLYVDILLITSID